MSETHTGDTFYLAPLRGVTVRAFRNLQALWFMPPDYAVAPFIPTFAGDRIKPRLLKDVDLDFGQSLTIVPQVIGKDPEQLCVLLQAFKAMGYARADLNAGCPYPFIVKKGRGAGLMRDATVFARMLETGCKMMPKGFSVKIRLGIDTSDLLLKRMSMINAFPLCEVTIHGRTAHQMYEGQVDLNAFAAAMTACRHPVVYNGDILSRHDYMYLKQRFPSVTRWMVGRGVARDPFLFHELRTNQKCVRDAARLRGFLDDYLAVCEEELYGPVSVLGRMKELWSYLHQGLRQGEQFWRYIRVCRTLDEYRRVINELFESFPGFEVARPNSFANYASIRLKSIGSDGR